VPLINCDSLWDRNRAAIEQTKGLPLWTGARSSMLSVASKTRNPTSNESLLARIHPEVVVFVDEIEKAFAGMSTQCVCLERQQGCHYCQFQMYSLGI
jgi:hypothetical protein